MNTKEILQGIKDWAAPKVIYDISAAHNNTKYTDLSDALGTDGGNIPQEYRKGGVTVRYVQTSDNKYVQYRLMLSTFTAAQFINTANWQGVGNTPIVDSDDMVKSGGIKAAIGGYTLYQGYTNTSGGIINNASRVTTGPIKTYGKKILLSFDNQDCKANIIYGDAKNSLPNSIADASKYGEPYVFAENAEWIAVIILCQAHNIAPSDINMTVISEDTELARNSIVLFTQQGVNEVTELYKGVSHNFFKFVQGNRNPILVNSSSILISSKVFRYDGNYKISCTDGYRLYVSYKEDGSSVFVDTSGYTSYILNGKGYAYIRMSKADNTQDIIPTEDTGIIMVDLNSASVLAEKALTDIAGVDDKVEDLVNGETFKRQLYDSTTNTPGGYYNKNGVWTSEAQYQSAEIDVSSTPYVVYKNLDTANSGSNTAFIYGFYDSSHVIIKGVREDYTSAVERVYAVPVGAKYFVFSTTNAEVANDDVSVYVTEPLSNLTQIFTKYRGKRLSILGDSISTFAGWLPSGNQAHYTGNNCGVSSVNQTWWMRLMITTGMKLLVNNSWGGTTVVGHDADDANVSRCVELDDGVTYPDVIIFFMGINDFRKGANLGSYDGNSAIPVGNSEFCDAYAITLKKMMDKYKNAKLFACTLLASDSVGEAGFPDVNSRDNTINDFNIAIRKICNALGVDVIELSACGINYWNMSEYMGDYEQGTPLHPNAEGMRLIYEKVLSSIY